MMLSLLQLVGRAYESNNGEDFKRNSNEKMTAVVIRTRHDRGKYLTLSPKNLRHLTNKRHTKITLRDTKTSRPIGAR